MGETVCRARRDNKEARSKGRLKEIILGTEK